MREAFNEGVADGLEIVGWCLGLLLLPLALLWRCIKLVKQLATDS